MSTVEEEQQQVEITDTPTAVSQIAPPNLTKAKKHIPWRILTKEIIKECMNVRGYRENNVKNPKAQGATVWLRWEMRKFRPFYPDLKFKLNEDRLCIQTPYMDMPFGMSEFNGKWGITLSFGKVLDDEVEEFEDWCINVFDAAIIELIAENSKKWLGNEYSAEMVKNIYAGLRKFSSQDEEKGYNPKTPGFKVLPKKLQPNLRGQHGKGNPIPVDEDHIKKFDYARVNVEFSTIWINKPSIGIGGNVAKIDIRTKDEMNNAGFALNPSESEIAEGAVGADADASASESAPATPAQEVEASA